MRAAAGFLLTGPGRQDGEVALIGRALESWAREVALYLTRMDGAMRPMAIRASSGGMGRTGAGLLRSLTSPWGCPLSCVLLIGDGRMVLESGRGWKLSKPPRFHPILLRGSIHPASSTSLRDPY